MSKAQVNRQRVKDKREWRRVKNVLRHGSRAAKVLVKRLMRQSYAPAQIVDATRLLKGRWLRENW